MNGWNPDAIAPPAHGGVYEREARDHRVLGIIASGLLFFGLLGLAAASMWRL